MKLGTEYNLPPLKKGHCYVNDELADKIDLDYGDVLQLQIYINAFYN